MNANNPDERFLRSWEGRFYVDTVDASDDDGEVDDDNATDDRDADDEPDKKERGYVTLTAGSPLAFVKVVLYQGGVEQAEPHLLYGVLRNCRVREEWKSLDAQRGVLHKVLEDVRADLKSGTLTTKATVRRPLNVVKRRGDDRLMFDVSGAPARVALFDIRSPDRIRKVAEDLKVLWTKASIG